MRSNAAQAASNRDRIVGEAARLFREKGFGGIGVARIMGEAGLTHGGFYSHFGSKEELMALACRRAVDDMLAEWRARIDAAPGDPQASIAEPYLSAGHRDAPGTGCLMAALGPDAARAAPPVRRAVTDCLGEVLDVIAGEMPAADPAERRRSAIRMFASLVGALVVARAVDTPALSDEILEAVLSGLR